MLWKFTAPARCVYVPGRNCSGRQSVRLLEIILNAGGGLQLGGDTLHRGNDRNGKPRSYQCIPLSAIENSASNEIEIGSRERDRVIEHRDGLCCTGSAAIRVE